MNIVITSIDKHGFMFNTNPPQGIFIELYMISSTYPPEKLKNQINQIVTII